MPSLDRLTVVELLTAVARDLGSLRALDLATKLQATGDHICPLLQARSDEAGRGVQGLVEGCVEAFNDLWLQTPPLPWPRQAGGTSLLRQRGLAQPLGRLFGSVVKGFGPVPPCRRCRDCDDERSRDPHAKFTPLGRRLLAAAPEALPGLLRDDAWLLELLEGGASNRALARADARRALASELRSL